MEARASTMAACDIGQCEPAALLLRDLSFSLAGRPPRWSIWPTRPHAVHRSDNKPFKGMNVSAADQTRSLRLAALNVFFSRKRSILVGKAEDQQSAPIAVLRAATSFRRKLLLPRSGLTRMNETAKVRARKWRWNFGEAVARCRRTTSSRGLEKSF